MGGNSKKPYLRARCIDCVWQNQIDKEKGYTSLTWLCPKSGHYLKASKGSLYSRRRCVAFIPKKYGEFLEAATEGEQRCFNGKRWDGHAVLVVVDAALDSIGLNYFKIVVPRVKRFYNDYVKTGQIASLEAFSMLSPRDSRLRKIMNNERTWEAAINICKELDRIKKENLLANDFAALKFWAEEASYEKWKEDPIGKIKGVGFITFQYLRMQSGVDTTMPDKIIKRAIEQDFGIKAKDDIHFVKKMEALSKEIGYSQTLICWAIWLKEANVKASNWEKIN